MLFRRSLTMVDALDCCSSVTVICSTTSQLAPLLLSVSSSAPSYPITLLTVPGLKRVFCGLQYGVGVTFGSSLKGHSTQNESGV